MGKAYKKKASRKKPIYLGKRKRISRRKMKGGGVALNTSFSISSLPSSTYIPFNPNVNDNPSWNQIDARLLPAMGGGKRTQKRRGAKKRRESRTHKKHGGITTYMDYVKAPYRAIHEFTRGKKSVGHLERIEQQKCDEFVIDMSENWIAIDGERLWRYYDSIKDDEEAFNNSLFKDIYFYKHEFECELSKLGKLKFEDKPDVLSKNLTGAYGIHAGFVSYYTLKFSELYDTPFKKRNNNNEIETLPRSDNAVTAWEKWSLKPYGDYHQFHIQKEDFDKIVEEYKKKPDEFKINLEKLSDEDFNKIVDKYKKNTDKFKIINPEDFKVDPRDDQFGKDYDPKIKRVARTEDRLTGSH